jgi:hypothetical protein
VNKWLQKIIFGYIFLTSIAFGDARDRLDILFETHFHEHYEPRHCGRNITRFLKAALKQDRHVDDLNVVTIENKGFSMFGLVNAEKARGWRFSVSSSVEKNWYHHVIALDDSGYVYDFDYTTSPTPIHIEEYLESMFLDEPECQRPYSGHFCIGRDTKLSDYEFTIMRALDFIQRKNNVVKQSVRMEKILNDWSSLLQH